VAKNSKRARRPAPKQMAAQRNRSGPGGAQQRSVSGRPQKRGRTGSSRIGWISVGVVVVVIAVFIVVKLTGSSTPTSTTGDSAGRNPAAAPASVTAPLAAVSPSVFDSIGVAGMPAALVVTAKQPLLKQGALSRFVYVGAEYCPYCAMDRWAMVTALDRFGSFTGLAILDSSSTDTPASIPTLSFLRSRYSSPYIVFTAYEEEDRNRNPLTTPPTNVATLFDTYDAPPNGNGTAFDSGQGGIPFIDVANKYVSAGTPGSFSTIINALQGDGLTNSQIAQAIADPTSPIGQAMGAKYEIGEANYLSAAICSVNGGKPSTVCGSAGVTAAAKILKAAKPVS